MKSHWAEEKIAYDGSQLHSRFALEKFNLQGDSIVAFRGPCDVPLQHMVDGEDRLAGQTICGADMVHFIAEVSGYNLLGITALQRLFACVVRESLGQPDITRTGDDLWLGDAKLSISVATVSPVSAVFHFAVNVTNVGTPVKTLSLSDLKIDPKNFAQKVLDLFVKEFEGIKSASEKVSWVK